MARSASTYESVIDDFKVETNRKYSSVGGTKCNIFAQDVMSAMSADLPSGLANQMADALLGNKTPGWYSVTFQDAQKRANLGYPTVGIRKAEGHGHVVVVRPKGSSITILKEVKIAQAGTKNYNSNTINYSWVAADLPGVKFYTHD
ncbi:hypothetical protein P4H71_20800 [Paenibacillus kribbensis]|uniref:hypothetical protein n=1 Tax=Paenibacillus kribbensis TaxID=172713 RepID=UPI002DB8AA66|nr:hypothetical protein [Paenibacillus kribbensis]MEC0236761.1 hypothetical protein [Paenibacillus kribbensis]